jgi:hypothetical protein
MRLIRIAAPKRDVDPGAGCPGCVPERVLEADNPAEHFGRHADVQVKRTLELTVADACLPRHLIDRRASARRGYPGQRTVERATVV